MVVVARVTADPTQNPDGPLSVRLSSNSADVTPAVIGTMTSTDNRSRRL